MEAHCDYGIRTVFGFKNGLRGDNDINFITRSFGFDTAVEKATEAIQSAQVEAFCLANAGDRVY
jgi:hypothetical protein